MCLRLYKNHGKTWSDTHQALKWVILKSIGWNEKGEGNGSLYGSELFTLLQWTYITLVFWKNKRKPDHFFFKVTLKKLPGRLLKYMNVLIFC